MDLVTVFKQGQRNTVDGGVTPSFVKEAAGAVQMVKVVLVRLAAPEGHVGNLKVTPEVAG